MFSTEIEDLKLQIVDGKKQNLLLKQENDSLKIRLRKLESTITHRNKIIDTLLNGGQPLTGKNAPEFGASLLLTLKEENEKLKLKVAEQLQTSKRLKRELVSSRLYLTAQAKHSSVSSVKSSRSSTSARSEISLQKLVPKVNLGMDKNNQKRSASEDRCKTKNELYVPVNTHKSENDKFALNKIQSDECNEIEAEPEYGYVECDGQSDSEYDDFQPESKKSEKRMNSIMIQVGDVDGQSGEKIENKDKPHEEIQMLQNSFRDIINEVRELKESICSIQKEQVKTCTVLQQKDSNLEKLATEIKNLTRTQYGMNPLADTTDSQVYKKIQMESKYKMNNRNPIGGTYGLTTKKKVEQNNTARQQYKVISSPTFNPNAIHIVENNRKIRCTESEVETCINNVVSDL